MGYVKGGETFESWCACCVDGPVRDDEWDLCRLCIMEADGPTRFSPLEWDCDGCGIRGLVGDHYQRCLGGSYFCGRCGWSILRGVEVARAQGITVRREPASDYYSTLINLDAIDAACKGGDE